MNVLSSICFQELYYGGLYHELSGKPEEAKEYLDRAIKNDPSHLNALSARGWTEIKLLRKDAGPQTPDHFFAYVLKEYNSQSLTKKGMYKINGFTQVIKKTFSFYRNRKHLDALLGLSKYLETCHDFFTSMDKQNQILAILPNWVPAIVEKMKVSLSTQDWDQATDLALR